MFGGGPVDCGDDAPGGGRPNGAAQEGEFAEDKGDSGARDHAFAGDNGFVDTGFGFSPVDGRPVVVADGAIVWGFIPGLEGVGVKDFVDKLLRSDMGHD